jgi:PST family polysaccharide transporter/lipopolysaccharide exporter
VVTARSETKGDLRDLRQRLISNGSALGAAQLVNRLFGFVRTITIARWLGPDEMGVYAVAALVISGLDQLTEIGLRSALIQRHGSVGAFIPGVRTVHALRGLIVGGVVLF